MTETHQTSVTPDSAAQDPTKTRAWQELAAFAQNFTPDLRGWFARDPGRAENLTHQAVDLHVDLSKNLVTQEIVDKLLELAEQTAVERQRERMFAGERINVTEDRAVLHTALRRPMDAAANFPLSVDEQNVAEDVHQQLERIYAFARRVRSGEWTGVTGKPIRTVVNIGIGGSDLGPVMVYEALLPYVMPGMQARFISNIDPADVTETLADLDPETTLVVVTSKTFTTLETITNAKLVREWMLEQLGQENDSAQVVQKHFVAVSTALDKVADFGIDTNNAFGFWDWVGGRYSVSGAVGTTLAIVLGPEVFAEFLNGLHAMDEHFRTAPKEKNVPVLLGLLNIWYTNFLGAASHAVLPYSQYLHRFPAYLQQMTMESNGKGVRWDGAPVSYDTGEIFWGEPGTNGQHAFYQLLHQGTRLVPADFIAFVNPETEVTQAGRDVHELFLSNFFAQTKALAFGKTGEEVAAEGTPKDLVNAKTFPGNRPSTSIMAPKLTPNTLGQLISLYEHSTFVEGAVWAVDSFDQWGVELGKQMATDLLPALEGQRQTLDDQDPSTRELINYYLKYRDR